MSTKAGAIQKPGAIQFDLTPMSVYGRFETVTRSTRAFRSAFADTLINVGQRANFYLASLEREAPELIVNVHGVSP